MCLYNMPATSYSTYICMYKIEKVEENINVDIKNQPRQNAARKAASNLLLGTILTICTI